jgi:hypothetical protein
MTERVTLFCGQTQSGKSTLALRLALNEYARTVVLDSARARVFDRISEGGRFDTWRDMRQWIAGPGLNLSRWCIALRSKNPADYARMLADSEYLCGVLILCDETHKLCRMGGVREPLELVALTGAHYGNGRGVALYMVTQRATGVPINVRSQAERVISFKQREPADLKWLAESCGEEFSEKVAALNEHDYLIWPSAGGEKQHGAANKEAGDVGAGGIGSRGIAVRADSNGKEEDARARADQHQEAGGEEARATE